MHSNEINVNCPTTKAASRACIRTSSIAPTQFEASESQMFVSKLYESCPVSPIRKEKEFGWPERNRLSRRTMYSEDAKTILEMIHDNTEKMIAEIAEKYGDLSIGHQGVAHRTIDEENLGSDQEFSSDSLEDCSLKSGAALPEMRRRKICCKKHRNNERALNPPKRSVSEYFIYDEFFLNRRRKVSLSDILDQPDDRKLDADGEQRHSSAGFFLSSDRKSQESLISDELSECYGGVSYCNSMESILSDESECKSAPLEALFGRSKREPVRSSSNVADYAAVSSMAASKSYGSSPNNGRSGFDQFIEQQQPQQPFGYNNACGGNERDFYGHENADMYTTYALPNSCTFPMLSARADSTIDDSIPRLMPKNEQYLLQMNKSLSSEFAAQRQLNNSNPLYKYNDYDCFQSGSNPPAASVKKSCSFEIDMSSAVNRLTQPRSAAKKYEQNLQKFERVRSHERNIRSQFGGTLEMNYVAHKPPVANRRSASLRTKRVVRDARCHSAIVHASAAEYVDADPDRTKCPRKHKKKAERASDASITCSRDKSKIYPILDADDGFDVRSFNGAEFLSQAEYSKFDDIVKKIDVINKLVQLEEKKLERERVAKELRMTPFNCDSNAKGYVRSLTMNFDSLAKSSQSQRNSLRRPGDATQMKRNFSLPDVLEVTQCMRKSDLSAAEKNDDFMAGTSEGLTHSLIPVTLLVFSYSFCFSFSFRFLFGFL